MTGNHATLLDEARGLLDDTVALRRRIHRQPELGLTLPRTQPTVLEALDGLGLDVRTGQQTTSVVAAARGRPTGPDDSAARRHGRAADAGGDRAPVRLGGRAARMHACGHDAHTAMLVGAARLLVRRRATLPARWCSCSSPARRAITARAS